MIGLTEIGCVCHLKGLVKLFGLRLVQARTKFALSRPLGSGSHDMPSLALYSIAKTSHPHTTYQTTNL